MNDVQARIAELVEQHPVVLFMKGSRQMPQCGFSARVVAVLDEYLPEYQTVNVLEDPAVREGIKVFSSWKTIPQLFVKGEFIGGCDIVEEMSANGELDDVLGVKRPEVPTPEVFMTDAALQALAQYHEGEGDMTLRIDVQPGWQYVLDFDQPRPGDLIVDGKVRLVMSRATARKVDGMKIDFMQTPDGGGFKIDNPHEPPRVKPLAVEELKTWLDTGKPIHMFDVRTPAERDRASIEGTQLFTDPTVLKDLDPDATLVFFCHHGPRSQRAADHALSQGFRSVYNLVGGIDAWSLRVDDSVPRY